MIVNRLIVYLFIFFLILNIINCDLLNSIESSSTTINHDTKPKIEFVYHRFNNCHIDIYAFSKIYNNEPVVIKFNNLIINDTSIAYLNEDQVSKLNDQGVNNYLATALEKEYLKIILLKTTSNISQFSNITIELQNNNGNFEPSQYKEIKLKSNICSNNIQERILELNGVFFYLNNTIVPIITLESVTKDKLYHQCKVIKASNSTIRCILDKSFYSGGCALRIKIKNLIGYEQQFNVLDERICTEKPIIKKLYLYQDAVSRSFKATIIGKNFEGGVRGFLLLECKNKVNITLISNGSENDIFNSDSDKLASLGNRFDSESSTLHEHIVIYNFPDEVSDVLEMNDYNNKEYFNYLIIELSNNYTSNRELIPISWNQVIVNNSDSRLIGLIAIPGFLFMVAIILATTLLFKTIYKKNKNLNSYQIDGANISEDNIENNNNVNQSESETQTNDSNNNNNNNLNKMDNNEDGENENSNNIEMRIL